MEHNRQDLLDKITSFLSGIGLKLRFASLDFPTFLPGIHIENGVLLVDKDKLTYPGDLLHEAGHLALLAPEDRMKASGNLEPGESKQNTLEMGVICWSWAALLHLDLDPKVVFHEGGYRGGSEWYIQMYSTGNYIGLPLLQWMQLCKHQDDISNQLPFPYMLKWTRE